MAKNLILTFIICFVSSMVLSNEFESNRLNNWPHWRGPQVNGFVPNGNPPLHWDENRNIKWKVEIPGAGSATPIIWDNQVFIITAIKTDRMKDGAEEVQEAFQEVAPPDYRRNRHGGGGRGRRGRGFGGFEPTHFYRFIVMSLDKNTGKILWEKNVTEEVPHEGHHRTGTFASGSPTTDGQHLYVTFGSRGLFCFDLKGNLKWKRDLGDMQTRLSFGEGASPVLYADSLIVNWDHEGSSFIVCLDALSGDIRWKTKRDERTTWATPLITEHEGVVQVIVNGADHVRSYDLTTGKLIWQSNGLTANPIPSPVRFGNHVLCTSGFRGSAFHSIPLDARGDITGSAKIAWMYNQDTPYVPSPLLYDDRLYFLRSNDAVLTSLNANDGSPVIEASQLPVIGNIYASPIGAGGHVYISTREGETIVLKHGDKLEILGVNTLDEEFDASPVVVGNQLFLRGEKFLYCIEES